MYLSIKLLWLNPKALTYFMGPVHLNYVIKEYILLSLRKIPDFDQIITYTKFPKMERAHLLGTGAALLMLPAVWAQCYAEITHKRWWSASDSDLRPGVSGAEEHLKDNVTACIPGGGCVACFFRCLAVVTSCSARKDAFSCWPHAWFLNKCSSLSILSIEAPVMEHRLVHASWGTSWQKHREPWII